MSETWKLSEEELNELIRECVLENKKLKKLLSVVEECEDRLIQKVRELQTELKTVYANYQRRRDKVGQVGKRLQDKVRKIINS